MQRLPAGWDMFFRKNLAQLIDRRKRVVIIHDHLFKNAGSTIDWILKKNFGKNFIDHRDDEEMKKGPEYLKTYIGRHKNIQAISSHHFSPPLPELQDVRFVLIKMFRNPIERVLSIYNFEKKQRPARSAGACYASTHDFQDYVDWRLSDRAGAVMRNFHVRRLLERRYRKNQITDELYAMALENLEKVELIGLVEQFDDSMLLFEDKLSLYFNNLDFKYIAQNVNKKGRVKGESGESQVRSMLSDSLYERLLEENAYDTMLMTRVQELFAQRFACLERKTNRGL